MIERGLYVGDDTALAARVRAENLRRRMSAGPLQHLAALAALITGRVEGSFQDVENADFCRRFLTARGHDPGSHAVARKNGGLIVRDEHGQPVEWLSAQKLRALMADADFLGAFA